MASSIQLLRSNNPKERPFPGNLLDGQPAINTNVEEPGLFFKANDGSIVKIGPATITSDGNPPNTGGTGQPGNTIGELWLDKALIPPVFKIYDGSQWIEAGSGGGGETPGVFVRWVYTATGGETALSGFSGGILLQYQTGREQVYTNGALLTPSLDYLAINGSSLTNLQPLSPGDLVVVLSSLPLDGAGVTSINGLTGTVSLTAGSLNAYNKEEVNELLSEQNNIIFITQAQGNDPQVNVDAVTTERDAASFLRKTTLGPTPPEIENLLQIGSKRQWLLDQISSSFDNSTFSEWDDSGEVLKHKPGWFGNVGLSLRWPINTSVSGTGLAWWRPGDYMVSRAILSAFIRNNPVVGGMGSLDPSATYKDPRKSLLCKVTWVLSKFFPVSIPGNGFDETPGLSIIEWYSLLGRYAFSNYADLLEAVTYNTSMAAMLTHLRNKKESPSGNQPDENYAREIIQLFTIGLYQLNIDGSFVLDENGNRIENYDNTDIYQMSRVFTGLTRWDRPSNHYYDDSPARELDMEGGGTNNVLIDGLAFQVENIVYGTARLARYIEKGKTYRIFSLGTTDFVSFGALSPVSIGQLFTATASGTINSGSGEVEEQLVYPPGMIPRLKHYIPWYEFGEKSLPNIGINIPANTDPVTNIKLAIQGLISHPSCAPYVAKSLIKLTITSNPSPEYVARVASVFRNNGKGVAGDMISVWIAIFTDPEANYTADSSRVSGRVRDGFECYCNVYRSLDASSFIGSSITQQPPFNDPNNEVVSRYDLYWEGQYQSGLFPGLIEQREFGTGMASFGSWPFMSFSIFGYYSLDFSIPPALDWGVSVPELGSLPPNTLLRAHNALANNVRVLNPVSYRNRIANLNSVPINTVFIRSFSDVIGDLNSADNIVNKLDLILCGGGLDVQQKRTIVQYLETLPSSSQNQRDDRVSRAIVMLLSSPEFWIN
jgi:hypothetical protein